MRTFLVAVSMVFLEGCIQPVCEDLGCDGGARDASVVGGGTATGAGGGGTPTGGGGGATAGGGGGTGTIITDSGIVIDGVQYLPDAGEACTGAVRVFASAAECTPATCSDGCCDGARCIRSCAQTGGRCGVYAEACVSCAAGDTCDLGYCRGSGPCSGCRNTDLCYPGTLPFACGSMSCGLCESCIDQQCVTPPIHVGDACTTDAQCAAMGRGAYCRKQTSSGTPYPGGFCTFPCEGDWKVCGSTSECVEFPARFGETARICAPHCTQGDAGVGCRAGYECLDRASWNGIATCWISPPPMTGTPVVGSACIVDAHCGQGQRCLRPYVAASFNGYWAGYCTATCTPGQACGNGDVCVSEAFDTPVGPAFVNGCKAKCSAPGFQAECRADYVCQPSAQGSWCAPRCSWRGCPSGETCDFGSGVCR